MQRMADYDYGHNLDDARALALMLNALKTLPQPTIARVQGNAFGGALGLISCCDIAVADSDARFGLTETRIGLIPATIGPHVIEAIGPRWARRLFLTAERFDAALAARINLVHEVCETAQLDTRIETLLDGLLQNGPVAMREAKQLIREIQGRPVDDELIDDTSARIAHLRVSEEGQEGLQAFLQKRRPGWQNGGEA
jgi:methylglutaconyl-CoA hydratase